MVRRSQAGRAALLVGLVGVSVGAAVAKELSGPAGASSLVVSGPPSSSSTSVTTGVGATPTTQPAVGAGKPSSTSPSTSTSTSTSPSTSAQPSTQKINGAAESFPFGTIQVQVVLTAGKIVNVVTIQAPQEGYSAQVAQSSLPTLRNEVIAAQSAKIDVVSGASYDSQANAASVQSALDQAKA
jgi:uncharacterized protein with FMN-binding domain